MEILQIVILIIGAIIFTISFFIPDKQVSSKEIREKEEKAIKEIIDKELSGIRQRIDEVTEESIERAKDTTERQMDRITNEKMMAINEYSDTVMTEIHKNHEEAVFLYDMLNNKHAQVKTTAAELNQTIKLSKQTQNAVKSKTADKNTKKNAEEVNNALESAFEPITYEETQKVIEEPKADKKRDTKSEVSAFDTKEGAASISTSGIEMMFASDSSESNSNDQILELHKAGKSNMAIARELGLGIGEVKLVIDLFEGGM